MTLPDDAQTQRLFCEIVAQLIIADAQITDAERDFLQRLFDKFGFDQAQRQEVYGSVNMGEPVEPRLQRLPPDVLPSLLAELESVASIDGSIAPTERQILDELRAKLGFTS